MPIIAIFDYAGVAFLAATGALAASRKQIDIMGFVFLALLAGTGGGTLRDLILGVDVFWVENPAYILICTSAAVIMFFTAHLIMSRYGLILWLDAAALAAYGIFGAYKGLMVTDSATIAIVTGVMTGTLGGVLRDIVANEPSVLLRREIYVTAALAGSVCFVLGEALGFGLVASAAFGAAVTFGLRGLALYFDWGLPLYRPRPPRNP